MKTTMVKFIIRLCVVVLVAGLLLWACASPTGSSSKHCNDEDYPLWCSTNKACCPRGYPVNCGGKCYTTEGAARNSCDARIDTCYRE